MTIDAVEFPRQIAIGAVYGPSDKVNEIPMSSGFEQRDIRWVAPLCEGNIGTGIKDPDGMQNVIAFFRARRASAYGFLFFDFSDYQATNQLIVADATAGQATAQLVKTYADAVRPQIRTIFKPILTWTTPGFDPPPYGSLQLFKNGSGTPMGGGTYSVNQVTGVITFTPTLALHDVIRATFRFYNPVRFATKTLGLALRQFDSGEVPNIPIKEIRCKTDGQG